MQTTFKKDVKNIDFGIQAIAEGAKVYQGIL